MPPATIDMTLIYETLKAVQNGLADMRREMREGFKDTNSRLTLMDGTLRSIHSEISNPSAALRTGLYGLYAHQGGRVDRLEARVERIERRLDLRDEQ